MLPFGFWIFFCASFYEGTGIKKNVNPHELPSWLKDNPAFQNLTEINSLESGVGEISWNVSDSLGWLVMLNNETGYGAHIVLKELILDSETNDYLLLAAWPISENHFKQIKILTGKFEESQTFRILNAKQFVVLFQSSDSNISPALVLNYTRYGSAYKKKIPPPDDPIKKETLFEVHLKGRSSQNYSDKKFLTELKEAIRKEAEAYCLAKEIPFDSNITTEEMVYFKRISFCPFDWPDRDICVSLKHSVYVSGEKIPEEQIILNYQLTADKLRDMWMQNELPEMRKLGLFVFKLPEPSSVAMWWTLISGMAVISSLIMVCLFWKNNLSKKISRESSASFNLKDVKIRKKPTFQISKHQQIPNFVLKKNEEKSYAQVELISNSSKSENKRRNSLNDAPSGSPIKNYFGSLIFSSNKGFEDDENVEANSPKEA